VQPGGRSLAENLERKGLIKMNEHIENLKEKLIEVVPVSETGGHLELPKFRFPAMPR
jgi:hypothetical protein